MNGYDRLAVFSILGSAGYGVAVYDRLPDRVPTHFDLSGNPNGWMPKAFVVWALPAFAFGMWAFLRFVVRILPRLDKKRPSLAHVSLVAALVAMFMSGIDVVVLRAAVIPGRPVIGPAFVLVGALLVALGLVLPRIRRNAFIGIRTPWTLTSDENWARTHRMAGYAMVAGGLLGIAAAALGGPAVAIACFVVSGIAPAIYSVVIARRRV